MQIGESIELPPVEPPKQEEDDDGSVHINLRVSLFYDGTKNNRENVQSRQSTSQDKNAAYQATRAKKYVVFGELDSGDVSYTTDESNISFLEAYLESKTNGNDLHLKVYTEGAGTVNLGRDATAGAGFGAGETGIPAKVRKGIAETQPFETGKPDMIIRVNSLVWKELGAKIRNPITTFLNGEIQIEGSQFKFIEFMDLFEID